MSTQTHIDIGTSQLGYRRTGEGPDIVFVHGWPLHRETWRDVVAHLPGYTCHLIDLPGSGRSVTPDTTKISLRGHADAVVAAVRELGLERVVLAGHDSGGMIARFAAAQLSEAELGCTVDAMILTGTEIPFHHPAIISRLQKVAKLPGAAALMRRLVNVPRIARSNQMLGGCFKNRDLLEGSFRTEVLDVAFRDTAAVRRQIEALASYSPELVDELAEIHPNLTCPVLLVWGKGDPYFPVGKVPAMAEQFGGSTRFEVIDDARLLVHEEHPERFAKLCTDFLTEVHTA